LGQTDDAARDRDRPRFHDHITIVAGAVGAIVG
jgi:hypothetical protein